MQAIINRQAEFQEKYANTSFEVMYKALLEELGEFTASLGYHDWKKSARDERNIIVELIDMTIFATNCLYYKPELRKNNADNIQPVMLVDDFEFLKVMVTQIALMDFEGLIATIFTNYPEVKLRVVGKQALNILRQENGYKTGDYNKHWSGREDNEYLMDILDHCKSFTEIQSKLKALYSVHN